MKKLKKLLPEDSSEEEEVVEVKRLSVVSEQKCEEESRVSNEIHKVSDDSNLE